MLPHIHTNTINQLKRELRRRSSCDLEAQLHFNEVIEIHCRKQWERPQVEHVSLRIKISDCEVMASVAQSWIRKDWQQLCLWWQPTNPPQNGRTRLNVKGKFCGEFNFFQISLVKSYQGNENPDEANGAAQCDGVARPDDSSCSPHGKWLLGCNHLRVGCKKKKDNG